MEMDGCASENSAADGPKGSTEKIVAGLWSEVLQMNTLPDLDSNFFAMGGDSMSMIILELHVQEEFEMVIPVGTLLNVPTLRELCAYIDSSR
jgi:acyl carrier protein